MFFSRFVLVFKLVERFPSFCDAVQLDHRTASQEVALLCVEQGLGDVVLPEDPQTVESLLGLLHYCGCASTPDVSTRSPLMNTEAECQICSS